MADDGSFSALVGDVYRAAGDVHHWRVALEGLTRLTGARGAALAVARGRALDASATHTFTDDPGVAAQLAGAATRGAYTGRRSGEIVDADPIDGLPAVTACVIADTGLASCLVVAGTTAGEPVLGRLLPHLQSALRMAVRWQELEVRARALGDVIDRVNLGVFLVEARGRIVLANAVARRVARSGAGLRVVGGRLRLGAPPQEELLASLIDGALCAASGHARSTIAGGRVVVERAPGEQPLNLYVMPLIPRDTTLPPGRPHAVVFVVDPVPDLATLSEVLQTAFGLTFAEARLASRIASGCTVEEACRQLHVTMNTARTQLKAVFAKTGVGRQAELVRLLLLLALPMPGLEG